MYPDTFLWKCFVKTFHLKTSFLFFIVFKSFRIAKKFCDSFSEKKKIQECILKDFLFSSKVNFFFFPKIFRRNFFLNINVSFKKKKSPENSFPVFTNKEHFRPWNSLFLKMHFHSVSHLKIKTFSWSFFVLFCFVLFFYTILLKLLIKFTLTTLFFTSSQVINSGKKIILIRLRKWIL